MASKAPSRLTGTSPLVGWLNKLLDYACSLELTSVRGGRLERGSRGTQLTVDDRRSLPTIRLNVCMDDGTIKKYIFFAFEEAPTPEITADRADVTADTDNATADS